MRRALWLSWLPINPPSWLLSFFTSDRPRYKEFQESFVVFLDLLGFDDEVRQISSESDFDRIGLTLYAFKAESERLSRASGVLQELRVTAISDSIIATLPIGSPAGLPSLLTLIHEFQYTLLSKYGRLSRGYVAKGPVYHSEGLLFGRGYSDAYKGESTLKGPPRARLSDELVSYIEGKVSGAPDTAEFITPYDLLATDDDGALFVDYLLPAPGSSQRLRAEIPDDRSRIRSLLQNNLELYKTNAGLLAKISWLDDYLRGVEQFEATQTIARPTGQRSARLWRAQPPGASGSQSPAT